MTESLIHPTAIISPGAGIGEGTSVGPYSVIGPNVILGKNNRVGPHVVIEGHTTIGDDNFIFQFASVGAAPQDLKYRGEASLLEIGSGNRIREFVTMQPGTEGGGMLTRVGDKNLFMANCHVGHDALIGDSNVFANSAALAGHVIVGNGVTVGGLSGIHQFVRIGDLAILGAGSMVSKDIPPFCIAQGDRAGLVGINRVALERRGYKTDEILRLRKIYREIFAAGGKISDKVTALKEANGDFALGASFLDFFLSSERGCAGPRKGQSDNISD